MHGLEAGNVFRLKALGTLFHFKFNCLAFVERFVSVHHDGGEVHENIFSGLALDESIALRSIEPLHCSLFLAHFHDLTRATPKRPGPHWNCIVTLGPSAGMTAGWMPADLPSPATALSPTKKAASVGLAAPSNESKGSTRATNAAIIVPRTGQIFHSHEATCGLRLSGKPLKCRRPPGKSCKCCI